MEITCNSCSTKLSIPDERLPKGVPVVTGKCPHCQQPVEIHIPQPAGSDGAATPMPAAATPPAPSDAPPSAVSTPGPTGSTGPAIAPQAENPAPVSPTPAANTASPPPDEEFVEGRSLAMACFDAGQSQALAKSALEEAGYAVHSPVKPEDALGWLRRNKYGVLLLHEEYGGSAANNILLRAVQVMAMPLRRHMCVGLVGKGFSTMDNMLAFAKSVNFVVAERDLGKLKAIIRQAIADNDQFYRVFREALREVGKA